MAKKPRAKESSLEKYVRMLKRLGFKKVLEIPFTMPGGRNEKFFVFYHTKHSILFKFDTFLGLQVRDGVFYFNWKCGISISDPDELRARIGTFNGHWASSGRRNVLVGYDYIMKADHVRETIVEMERYGTFMSPWIESQPLDLTHYGDPHYARVVVTNERIMTLPAEVRKALLL